MKKWIGGVIGAILSLIVILLGYSNVQSPPMAGEPLAAQRNIPWPAVIAHRGASFYAPEETRPAYLLALEIGVDYLEGDVQRTRDGVLILFHDDTLERTTDVASVYPDRKNLTIENFTYAELQRLDAGSWFNDKHPEYARQSFVGERIMRLEDLLILLKDLENPAGLYLETKAASRFPGIESDLVALLRRYGWLEREPGALIFQSFEGDSLRELERLAPDVMRVYLINDELNGHASWTAALEEATTVGTGIGPVGYKALPWYLGAAHRRGLLIHPYTINAPWQMYIVSQSGADGFFSDRPDLVLLYYGKKEEVDLEASFESIGY